MNDNKIIIKNVVKKKRDYLVETNQDDIRLDEDTIIKYGVFKDKVFTKTEFDEIIQTNLQNKSFLKAINYLSYRARTENEIKQYLQKEELPLQIIQNIIDKLKQFGYINDHQFALSLFDYESRVKLRGPLYLENSLRTKGVCDEIIYEVLSQYSIDLQMHNIEVIINKELKIQKKHPPRKIKQLISQKLLRNGYDSSLVFEQINRVEIIDDSMDTLKKDFTKLIKKYQNKDFTTQELKSKIITNLLNKGYEYANILELFTNFEY